MRNRMSRRDALRLGTNAAASAVVTSVWAAGRGSRGIETPVGNESPVTDEAADAEKSQASGSSSDEVCFMKAVELRDLIRQKKISAREVMQAHLKQIARVNPKVNAVVTLQPEDQLMAQALAA